MRRKNYVFEADYMNYLEKITSARSSSSLYTKKAYVEWATDYYKISKTEAQKRFDSLNHKRKHGGGKDDECTVCYKEPEAFLIKYTCYQCSQPVCENCMSEMIDKGLLACPSCRSHFKGMQIVMQNNSGSTNNFKTLLTYMSTAEDHPDIKNNRIKAFVLAYVYTLIKQKKTNLEFVYSIHDLLWIASLAVLLLSYYAGRVLPSIHNIDIMIVFFLFTCTYKKTRPLVDDVLSAYLSPKNKEVTRFFMKETNRNTLMNYMLTCGFYAPTTYELGFDPAARTATTKFLKEFHDALQTAISFLTEKNARGKYNAIIEELKSILPSFQGMISYVEMK